MSDEEEVWNEFLRIRVATRDLVRGYKVREKLKALQRREEEEEEEEKEKVYPFGRYGYGTTGYGASLGQGDFYNGDFSPTDFK